MSKRKAIKEMMDQVEAGNAYTVEAHGEPVAVVVPWEHWDTLKKALAKLGVKK